MVGGQELGGVRQAMPNRPEPHSGLPRRQRTVDAVSTSRYWQGGAVPSILVQLASRQPQPLAPLDHMSISPKFIAPLVLLTACAGPSSHSPVTSGDTTVICTTDDAKSMMVAQFLDQYAKGDLSFADEMFTDDVGFYWGTRESSFSEEEWREGMTAQHSVFKDIELLDRVITTGTYPDGLTWTTVWAEWTAMNSATNETSKYLIHLAYEWDGDRVAAEYGFFDRARYEAELAAALGQ